MNEKSYKLSVGLFQSVGETKDNNFQRIETTQRMKDFLGSDAFDF